MENCDEKILRMFLAFGIKKDRELATKLNVAANTISTWRKRKKIPREHLLTTAQLTGASYEWLNTGQGEGPTQPNPLPKSPRPDHTEVTFSKNNSGGDQDIMRRLAQAKEVLTSKTVFAAALDANIVAFHRSIQTETEVAEMKKFLNDRFNANLEAGEETLTVAGEIDAIDGSGGQ